MKVYKLMVYRADHMCDFGALKPVDYALVKKTPFSVKEIITGQELRTFFYGDKCLYNLSSRAYEKYGYDLGVKYEDFKPANLAVEMDLDRYLEHFKDSDLRTIINSMKKRKEHKKESKKEMKRVNERVKQLQKQF